MKKLLLTMITTALLQGCVSATFKKTGTDYTITRKAFLYPFKLGAVEVDPQTGIITLLDYNTDGGGANAAAVTDAAITAALRAAK